MPTLESMIFSRRLNFFTKCVGNLKAESAQKELFDTIIESGCNYMTHYVQLLDTFHTKIRSKSTTTTFCWMTLVNSHKTLKTTNFSFTNNSIQTWRQLTLENTSHISLLTFYLPQYANRNRTLHSPTRLSNFWIWNFKNTDLCKSVLFLRIFWPPGSFLQPPVYWFSKKRSNIHEECNCIANIWLFPP